MYSFRCIANHEMHDATSKVHSGICEAHQSGPKSLTCNLKDWDINDLLIGDRKEFAKGAKCVNITEVYKATTESLHANQH